jgi:hypothetical protein
LILAVFGTSVLAHDPPHAEVEKAHPEHDVGGNVAEAATDPSAILMQMGFYYQGTYPEGTSRNDSDLFLIQPVLPLSSKNILRPTLPILNSPEPDRKAGLGDLFAFDLQLFPTKNNTFGAGAAVTFPTASDDRLGAGKLSLGPAFVWLYKGVPKTLFGILAYNQWSVAGDDDRDGVNLLSVQPIFVKHFKWGYIRWTDQTATVDWKHNNRFVIPAGIGFGKVLKAKTPWNFAVTPFWMFHEGCCGMSDNDSWGIKFQATAIFPTLMQPKKKG